MVTASKWAESQPGLELSFRDQPMTPARWPNEGVVKIPGFPEGVTPKKLWGKVRGNTSQRSTDVHAMCPVRAPMWQAERCGCAWL